MGGDPFEFATVQMGQLLVIGWLRSELSLPILGYACQFTPEGTRLSLASRGLSD